ncbi:MAG: tRNA (adenosine(37)-N6)-dimethylallyltransferase MiaA, partial [Minisyncoccia bacterium]
MNKQTKTKNKIKIIVIAGPTAAGKSDFAVYVAKKINPLTCGEIVSADSRQVYTGMDIGTGKVPRDKILKSKSKKLTADEYVYKGVPHHLLDVANPKKVFTVAQYKKLADKKIKEITKRGNIPIICGGTGFYIDAVVSGQIFPEVPPNNALRKKLALLSITELFEKLQKLDKVRAGNIDKNNPVRLIRAIEIATALGKVPKLNTLVEGSNSPYEVLYVGLTLPDEVLKQNIYTRLHKRIKAGMVKEVEKLHTPPAGGGVSWKRMEDLGLEYRYIAHYLQGKLEIERNKNISKKESTKLVKQLLAETLEKLNTEIWHYAKRQKTWFKRNKDIVLVDP